MVQSHASDRARLLLSLAFAHLLYFSCLFSNPLMATCPPPSRVPSPGYAFPQPLTMVTIVIWQDPPDSSGLTHADIGI